MEENCKSLEGCMEKAAEDVPRTATKGKKGGKSKSFKKENPLEQRQAQSARIVDRFPDRIPAIIERAEKSDVPEIVNKKFLLPPDMTVGHLMFMIRKKIGLSAEKAIFVFVADVLPSTSALMCAIYDEHKDEDGFLYFTYSGESTFGGMDLNLPAGNCLSRA